MISVTNERSACTFKRESPVRLRERRRNAHRTPARGVDAGQRDARRRQHRFVAAHFLPSDEAACAALLDFDRDGERIVQSGRLPEVDFAAMHDEHDAVFTLEGGERESERGQPFGARALHELQVVGVVDDAGGIGILVVNADREARRVAPVRSFAGKRSAAAAAAAASGRNGGTTARWRCGRATSAAGIPAGSGTARARPRSCRAPRRSPRRGCRRRPGRRANFSSTRVQELAVHHVESRARRRRASTARRRRPGRVTSPSRLHFGEVAHAAQQAVGDARRAARAARDLARAFGLDRRSSSSARRALHDARQLLGV